MSPPPRGETPLMGPQLYSVSQRVDTLEAARFVGHSTTSQLQSSLVELEDRLRFHNGVSASSVTHDTNTAIMQALNGQHHDEDEDESSNSPHPISDAANVRSAQQLKDLLQSQLGDLGASTDDFPALLDANEYHHSINAVASSSNVLLAPPTPPFRPRRTKQNQARPLLKHDAEADEDADDKKKKKRPRKPELSRTVRSTMFTMLGLSTIASSTPVTRATPSTPAKFHGYTALPPLPDFTPHNVFDNHTGIRMWRWEWDKTIRQSSYNAAFAAAINHQVTNDRAQGMHAEVPEMDWAFLDEAIDSAYTNLRRERDAQVDPTKKAKKEEHRRRNKMRGIKEDKCKRRAKALLVQQSLGPDEPQLDVDQPSPWLDVIDPAATASSLPLPPTEVQLLLELRYMSSEDEVEPNSALFDQHATPLVLDLDGTPITLSPSDKVLTVHRPAWRSEVVTRTYLELDRHKPPSGGFRRVLGEAREDFPPADTPEFMVNEEWREKIERSTTGFKNM